MLKSFLSLFLLSLLSVFAITPCWGQDSFEEDNTYGQAAVIVINDVAPQHHTLHAADDVDWVVVYALAGEDYAIKTYNVEPGIDPSIELYDSDGTTLLDEFNYFADPAHDDILDWSCPQDGIYYVKIRQAYPQTYESAAGYDLAVYTTSLLTFPVYMTGTVQSSSGQSIAYARIVASGGNSGSGLSASNGSFLLSLEQGTYTLSVSAAGYQPVSISSVAPASSLIISLQPDFVNTPPIAGPDAYTVAVGGVVTGNVLGNDMDPDGDQLTAVLAGSTMYGSLLLNGDGSFTYQHDSRSFLTDSFTYYVTDGAANSNIVPVTISVKRSALIAPVMLLLKR